MDELSQLQTQLEEHDEALSNAREALLLTRTCADPRAEAAVLGTLGQALVAAGATAEARTHLHAAHTIATHHVYAFYLIRAQIGLAQADHADGLLDSAQKRALSAQCDAHRHTFTALETEAAHLRTRIHLSQGNADQTA